MSNPVNVVGSGDEMVSTLRGTGAEGTWVGSKFQYWLFNHLQSIFITFWVIIHLVDRFVCERENE